MLDMYDRAATEGRLTINRTVSVEDLNRTRARLIELSDDNVRLRERDMLLQEGDKLLEQSNRRLREENKRLEARMIARAEETQRLQAKVLDLVEERDRAIALNLLDRRGADVTQGGAEPPPQLSPEGVP